MEYTSSKFELLKGHCKERRKIGAKAPAILMEEAQDWFNVLNPECAKTERKEWPAHCAAFIRDIRESAVMEEFRAEYPAKSVDTYLSNAKIVALAVLAGKDTDEDGEALAATACLEVGKKERDKTPGWPKSNNGGGSNGSSLKKIVSKEVRELAARAKDALVSGDATEAAQVLRDLAKYAK